jgi:hypothetical protein
MRRAHEEGVAVEAAEAPTVPPAPARFSISTRLPNCVSSWAASGRANASVPPPAANGTMKVIGLSGHVWAWLGPTETTAISANRAH